MDEASTAYPGGRRGDRAPCSAGTASTRLLRMPRVLTLPKATRTLRQGEEGEVRRRPQAVACRKRGVEERGKPPTLLDVDNLGSWYTALEARKGKPGHGTMLEPTLHGGPWDRQAGKYCYRESPPEADGVSYHA